MYIEISKQSILCTEQDVRSKPPLEILMDNHYHRDYTNTSPKPRSSIFSVHHSTTTTEITRYPLEMKEEIDAPISTDDSGTDLENARNQLSGVKPNEDHYLVEWVGPNDNELPMNFPLWKKVRVSVEVMTLGTSLTVLGFTVGPLIWGPMSELYGRLRPLYIGYAIFIVFQVPVAVAQNLETLMLGRFLLGFFGTSALASSLRAIAISLFSAATFVGPIFGPIIGGFIVDSTLGWRWTAWITMIPALFFGIIAFLTLPETYQPVLQRRANRLRREMHIWAYHSRLDEDPPTMREILTGYLFRPIQMLLLEPILVWMTIYISHIYGILYLFFVAYPITFREVRNWESLGIAALPFLGILIGVLIGCLLVTVATRLWYAPKLRSGSVVPEDRLPPMIIATFLLPVELFWFGWTSNPSISWVPQAIAGANTLIRSSVGAAFPLFATAMYYKLGVNWATSLLGFLSVAMIPIPVIFYFYGAKVRALSRFTPKP
ncbi:major facilitator superfamily domain-containing protein [Aspergillus falconensis]